jgi:hypothetical protein
MKRESKLSNPKTADDKQRQDRLLSRGRIAMAVLSVVGKDIIDSYENVDDHPGSLDLIPKRRRMARRKKLSK